MNTKEHKIEDRILKEVGSRYSNGLVKLLDANFKILREISGEVTGVKSSRDMDVLLEVDKDYLVNIEFQSSIVNVSADLLRFRYYSASTMLSKGKDVKTYIVYSAKFKPREISLKGEFGEFKSTPIFLYNISLNEEIDRIENYYNEYKKISEYDKILLILSTGLRCTSDRLSLIHRAVQVLNKLEDKETLGNLLLHLSSKFLEPNEFEQIREEIYMVDIVRDITERAKKEGMEAGMYKGKQENLRENIINLLPILSEEQIAKALKVDLDFVREIKASSSNSQNTVNKINL